MQWILFCSIDSFLASIGIGLLGCSKTNRRKLVIAFAVCDLIASLAGASLHSSLAQISGGGLHLLVVSISLAVVAAVLVTLSGEYSTAFLYIPVLLGVDNLIAGVVDGSTNVGWSPLLAGLASGLFAWSGFHIARLAGTLLSRRAAAAASVGLFILAFFVVN